MFGMKELGKSVSKETMPDTKFLEKDLTLLGATGLEDLLQDNVAQCITDFRDAGIKVWMLTGDKADTAHNIGISCGLISSTSQKVKTIDQLDNEQLIYELKQLSHGQPHIFKQP